MSKLLGKRILITRAKAQSESFEAKLSMLGAQTILFPTIEIQPLNDYQEFDATLKALDQFEWLIFTSVNTVLVLMERLKKLGINSLPKNIKTVSIGPKTKEAFEKFGYQTDFMPSKYVAEAILPGLLPIKGKKILLPQADKARKILGDLIKEQGGELFALTIYNTVAATLTELSTSQLKAGVDLITFTSPSTINNFATMTNSIGLDLNNLPGDPIFACIGPITAYRAKELNIPVAIVPEDYSVDGLIKAMIHYYHGEEKNDDK